MICSTKLTTAMSRENILPQGRGFEKEANRQRSAILFVSAIGIFACFFGREVVGWIVDMCSFGAAVTYFYVCLNTFRIAEKLPAKIVGAVGAAFPMLFMLLLILPFSPAALSAPALIFLCVWVAAGACFFGRMVLLDRKGKGG